MDNRIKRPRTILPATPLRAKLRRKTFETMRRARGSRAMRDRRSPR